MANTDETMNTEETPEVTAEEPCADEPQTQPAEDSEEVKRKQRVLPPHPYAEVLSEFQPNSWQLEEKDPQKCSSLEDSNFTMVDTSTLLDEMMLKLRDVTEFAMGRKHHSYRSFHGIVCLVQISTRTEDYLVDAQALKEELTVLNEVCIDTNILKVMHGGDRDLQWMQKEFGIYVINMFDTQIAARALEEEGAARRNSLLSNLLKKYASVDLKEEFQRRADWRVRPLPDDMIVYARDCVRYLLYIHDVFRNNLIKKKSLEDVYKLCTSACLTVWDPAERELRPDAYMACYKRSQGKLNTQQLECFRLIYEWRHSVSKENDESTEYTLPNKMMINISKALPKEPDGVLKCTRFGVPVSTLVEKHLNDVHKLILQAIENVPEVTSETVPKGNYKKGKGGDQAKNRKNEVKKKTTQSKRPCLSCGRFGHLAKDCRVKSPLVRGGGWNRGRPGGPGMRAGVPGFMGRGAPRPMGPMGYYGHPGGNMFHAGGPPYNPYNQHGAHPYFNAGGWW